MNLGFEANVAMSGALFICKECCILRAKARAENEIRSLLESQIELLMLGSHRRLSVEMVDPRGDLKSTEMQRPAQSTSV